MTTRRRIGVALAALAVGLVALGIGRSAWRRAQEPKYEGRTASEWLDYLARHTPTYGSAPELPLKETLVAFAHLGPPAERLVFHESTFSDPPPRIVEYFRSLAWRVPFLKNTRAFQPPRTRAWARDAVLASEYFGFHWNNIEEPLLRARASGNFNHWWCALGNLEHLQDGWTDALPLLTVELTNTATQLPHVALNVLCRFGTNASPALPLMITLIKSPEFQRDQNAMLVFRTADALARFGSSAAEALPALERWLGRTTDSFSRLRLASAIVHIDPYNSDARQFIAKRLLADPLATLMQLELYDEFHSNGTSNPLVVTVATAQLTNTASGSHMEAAQFLLRHDPYQARMALYSWLEMKDTYEELQVVEMLLNHDPRDQEALHQLTARIQATGFSASYGRIAVVRSFEHCLPDSPGVVELLKSIQPAPDDEPLRTAIRETLRHIELNGKLKELRARDAATGR